MAREPRPPPTIIPSSGPFGPGPNLEEIAVPTRGFPRAGKSAVIGGVLPRFAGTPRPLLEQSIASEMVGRFTLPGGATRVWKKIHVERPTVLMADVPDTPTDTSFWGPCIVYNYGKVPDDIGFGALFQAQVAEKTGLCFLSHPGDWYLLNALAGVVVGCPDIDCLLIDGSNPETVARLFRQPGVNFCSEQSYVIDDETVATFIDFGGRFVRAVTVQNVPTIASPAGAPIRYIVAQPPTDLVSAGAWTGTGFRLLVNGAVTFQGDALTRYGLYVTLEAAGETGLEVVQYRDR